jgi:hypothetical protein
MVLRIRAGSIRANHLHALNFLGADHCIRELEYLTSINTCISICILTIYRLHYKKCLGAQYKIRELPDININSSLQIFVVATDYFISM